MAVFWSIVIAFAVSFIRRDTALVPRKLIAALRGGSIGVLSVATTCASAGIIVGVVTLTGLGLKFSSIVIDYAGGNLLLTAIFTALVVWVIGLAVPVTASYIICAVIAAPGHDQAGRSRLRRSHVYLLLLHPVGGLPSHRPLPFRRRRPYRRRPLQDHHAGLEIHPSRFSRAL